MAGKGKKKAVGSPTSTKLPTLKEGGSSETSPDKNKPGQTAVAQENTGSSMVTRPKSPVAVVQPQAMVQTQQTQVSQNIGAGVGTMIMTEAYKRQSIITTQTPAVVSEVANTQPSITPQVPTETGATTTKTSPGAKIVSMAQTMGINTASSRMPQWERTGGRLKRSVRDEIEQMKKLELEARKMARAYDRVPNKGTLSTSFQGIRRQQIAYARDAAAKEGSLERIRQMVEEGEVRDPTDEERNKTLAEQWGLVEAGILIMAQVIATREQYQEWETASKGSLNVLTATIHGTSMDIRNTIEMPKAEVVGSQGGSSKTGNQDKQE